MFGRRQTDVPETRRSAATTGLAPLTTSADPAAGRSFGRRKDDAAIRVMHLPQQAAADGAGAAPTLMARTAAAAAPPSLTAQRSHLESIKDRIHPKLMSRMDVTAASALPREELKGPIG